MMLLVIHWVIFLFLSLVSVFVSFSSLRFFLVSVYVPRKSMKDVASMVRGGAYDSLGLHASIVGWSFSFNQRGRSAN
jgi:hypothetical protein